MLYFINTGLMHAGVMKINDLMTNDSRISYSCFKDKFCFLVSFR